MKTSLGWSLVLAWLLPITACVSADDIGLSSETQTVTVPAKGSATTLDVASWNLEFFGDPSNGPSDDALQLSNARDVIAGTDFDIWGLEEVVNATSFSS